MYPVAVFLNVRTNSVSKKSVSQRKCLTHRWPKQRPFHKHEQRHLLDLLGLFEAL
jgi:hypothetical protein